MSSAQLVEHDFRLDDERDPLRTLRGRVTWPSDVESVRGRRPYVLVLHGFKGFFEWGFYPELTRRLAARGWIVVRFNFSGSGIGEDLQRFSEERAFHANTPSRELEDVERVRAWLDSGAVPGLDPRRGALLGHSMGGGVALLHAAQRRDYRALVAWASVATFRRFPPEVEMLWRRQGFIEIPNLRTKEIMRLGLSWLEDLEHSVHELDVPAACRALATPSLFLHGDQDEAVPLAESEVLCAAFAAGVAQLEVIRNANHTFWAAHPLAGIPSTLERVFASTIAFLAPRLS